MTREELRSPKPRLPRVASRSSREIYALDTAFVIDGTKTPDRSLFQETLNRGGTKIPGSSHLCVSENTVKTHLAAMYKKLRVTTRLEAALHFYRDSKRNGHSSPKGLNDLKQTSRHRLKSKAS